MVVVWIEFVSLLRIKSCHIDFFNENFEHIIGIAFCLCFYPSCFPGGVGSSIAFQESLKKVLELFLH